MVGWVEYYIGGQEIWFYLFIYLFDVYRVFIILGCFMLGISKYLFLRCLLFNGGGVERNVIRQCYKILYTLLWEQVQVIEVEGGFRGGGIGEGFLQDKMLS